MAAQVLEAHQSLAAEKWVTLGFNPEGPVVIQADAGELEIIFNNLVSNAIKYNQDNGSVMVTVEDSPGEVTIAVRDTGIGMTPEEMARLFGEFSRIKQREDPQHPGLGPGPVDPAPAGHALWRGGEGAEHAGGGQHVHGDAAQVRAISPNRNIMR